MDPELAGKSDVLLLYSLLRRHGAIIENYEDTELKINKRDKAPQKVKFFEEFYQIDIGVGKDNTVSIYLCQDDVDAINRIIKQNHPTNYTQQRLSDNK
jgi:hypothetical protein